MHTVAEVVAEFLSLESGRYTPASLRARKYVWANFADFMGNIDLIGATPHHALKWISTLDLSLNTRRWFYATLNVPFNWAARVGLIRANPFKGLSFEEGEPRRAVTFAEFLAMVRCSERSFRGFLWALWLTGARPGEVSAFRWECVDLKAGVIVLDRHKTRKKTKRPRLIPLTTAAVRFFAGLARQRKADGGWVFVTQSGRPWSGKTLGPKVGRLRKRSGVPTDAKLHGIRHAWGTEMVARGVPIKLVSEAMGHASVAITEKFYVRLSAAHLQQIRQALDRG